jgi:hypothetical protein
MSLSPTQCAQFERILAEQPEGPLSADAAAHMQGCADCSVLWSDIEVIRTAGMEWGSQEVEPPEYLWGALRRQLESEGLIRDSKRENSQRTWFAAWFGAAPRWAVAGASISLLLVAAMLIGYQKNEPNRVAAFLPMRLTIAAARPRLVATDLGKALDGDFKQVFDSLPESDSALTSSLRENLGIVDNLIAVCEKSVREQPDDAVARDYLYGAYEQKAVLLAKAMDRSAMEGR